MVGCFVTHNCQPSLSHLQSIPREQFLILPSERLRRHPQTTVREVLRFIGAEENNNDSNNSGSNSDSGSGDANQEAVQSVRAPSPCTVVAPTSRSDNAEKEDDDDIHSVIQKQFPGPLFLCLLQLITRLCIYMALLSVA